MDGGPALGGPHRLVYIDVLGDYFIVTKGLVSAGRGYVVLTAYQDEKDESS